MQDTKLRAIREEKRKAIEEQDLTSQKEWTAKELAYLEDRVKKFPGNTRRMRSLLALLKQEERRAKREGDFWKVAEYTEKEEMLENRILAMNPEDQTIIRSLMKRMQKRIQKAMEEGNVEAAEIYKEQKSELEKRRKAKGKKPEAEKGDLVKEKKPSIEKMRKLIYESEDVLQTAKEIKEQMEGAEAADLQFLLAELYFHTGFTQRAQKSLKAYKKELGEAGQSVKLANLGLAVAMNSRTNKFNWDEFWRRKAELDRQERTTEYGEEEKD